MLFLLAAGFAIFQIFVVKQIFDSRTTNNSNQPQLVDKNYDFNILLIKRKILESITDSIQNIDNIVKLNKVIYDSSIVKLELVLIELENFKFDKDSAQPKFDMIYREISLELIIDVFEMIIHFDAYLPFSKQISFQAKVKANTILLGVTFNFQKKKMSLNKNWIQKFKIKSFIYEIGSDNGISQFFQDQVNDYLQKHHKYFENELLRIFEKEIQQSNESFDIIPQDDRIQDIQIVDPEILRITIKLYEDQTLQLT